MSHSEWKAVGKSLLSSTRASIESNDPATEIVLVRWQGEVFFGGLQQIFSEHDSEIVLLSKTNKPCPSELVRAIRETEPQVPVLDALDMLDLTGNYHVVRRVGNNLLEMTYEQTQYSAAHMPVIQDQQGKAGFGVLVDYPHPISDTNGCQ